MKVRRAQCHSVLKMAMNCGYFERETKIIITSYCLSRKLKELQKLKRVHYNNFIQIL